jgi:multidrug transporter EmrE-like cation transporter
LFTLWFADRDRFFTVIGAYLLFGEVFTVGQWLGVAVLLCGIFGLAVYNMRTVTLGA